MPGRSVTVPAKRRTRTPHSYDSSVTALLPNEVPAALVPTDLSHSGTARAMADWVDVPLGRLEPDQCAIDPEPAVAGARWDRVKAGLRGSPAFMPLTGPRAG